MFLFKRRKKRSVTIFGSCVSRDIMEYIPSENWSINLYAVRTKLFPKFLHLFNLMKKKLFWILHSRKERSLMI